MKRIVLMATAGALALSGCGQGSPSQTDNGLENKCGAIPKKPSEERWRKYLSCWGSYANENYDDRQIMTLLDGVYEGFPRDFMFVSTEIDVRKYGPICEAALEECAMAGDPMFCFEQKHPYWSSTYKAAGGTCLTINF